MRSLQILRRFFFFSGAVSFFNISLLSVFSCAGDDMGIFVYMPAIVANAGSSPLFYGQAHRGQYHLGPVDFAETKWHNACAPAGGYRSELHKCTGLGSEYLAGVSYYYSGGGAVCDRCIFIRTGKGKEITARVVTYGATGRNDIDVSPSVYAALNEGEYPREMTWQFVKCPKTGFIQYEFQTAASIWWSSLWVRNARVPIKKVEVKSQKHTDYYRLRQGSDGTFTDSGGFGAGPFTLRVTAIDGQVVEKLFNDFPTGQLVKSTNQFK